MNIECISSHSNGSMIYAEEDGFSNKWNISIDSRINIDLLMWSKVDLVELYWGRSAAEKFIPIIG